MKTPDDKPEINADNVESALTNETQNTQQPDSVKRLIKWMLWVCLFLFVWHLFADRITPTTDNARVRGYIVPIAPQISGEVLTVMVSFSEKVKTGQVLASIDAEKYQLAVDKAKADLDLVSQEMDVNTDNIAVFDAKVAQQAAELRYVQQQVTRYRELAARGAISLSELDKANAEVAKAKANYKASQADLKKAKNELGISDERNPKLRSALAALKQARLDLTNTRITAPTEGIVTDVDIDAGNYVKSGQALMTLISQRGVWVEAYLRENSLGNITAGNAVDIALDRAPGSIFKGTVAAITYGVQWEKTASNTAGLPTVPTPSGWLREAQRFPVIIRFNDDEASGFRLEGGQADVTIYTGNNVILNTLGWIGIRLRSYLSYIY